MTIKSVLIANRGEIAVRVIRACRELGVEAVQAYSKADGDSLPVRMADRSICVGGAASAESYLNIGALIQAAQMSSVDAVHPGYGFLSENAQFAESVVNAGFKFIGPDAQTIRMMGDKVEARKLAKQAGVPVVEGSPGPVANVEDAVHLASTIGYPILIKAAAGGGGRGMRVVNDEKQLRGNFDQASSEAEVSFGDGHIYMERYISPIHHVEVQIFGDGENVIHFGERDCTAQRRHQKLLEESPSPIVTPTLRDRMTAAACDLAKAVNYRGAGTLEFIVDPVRKEFFFIEMNTRIQVEHAITEEVTGVDLVKMQLLVADGQPLPLKQSDVVFRGHAIECRINAEDADKGFLPQPGVISTFDLPSGPGVRVDTHVFPSYTLPPFYDSMIAKLVVCGENRDAAIARMQRALAELRVEGVKTTREFHQRLLSEPAFISGEISTRYIKDTMYAGHPMQRLL